MGGEKFKYVAYSGIAVFVFAIIFFIGSIYITMVNGESRSQYEFSNFARQVEVNTYNGLHDANANITLFQNIQELIINNQYVAAAIVSSYDEPLFAYPVSSSMIQIDSTNKPVLLSSSPMLKTYSIALKIQNGQQLTLHAVTYILRPQDVFNAARVSFLLILAYTLALFVFIVYNYLRVEKVAAQEVTVDENQKEETTTSESAFTESEEVDNDPISVVFRENESTWDDLFGDDEKQEQEDYAQDDEPIGDEQDFTDFSQEFDTEIEVEGIQDNIEISQEEIAVSEDTEPTIIKEDESYFDESFVSDYIKEESADTTIEQDAEIEDSTVPEVSDPMGLFSDTTGVGWESYLETRLDSELIRAASSEQDLALIFIQIKGIEQSVVAKKKIATLLLDYFKYRDFVFEYKSDGFAGIILDINLDQTMILCEQLFKQLQDILDEEGLSLKVGIGLTTRSLRILPGSRIMTEASEAVARSFEEEDLPIVAFRVNPDKYRQYVSNTM